MAFTLVFKDNHNHNHCVTFKVKCKSIYESTYNMKKVMLSLPVERHYHRSEGPRIIIIPFTNLVRSIAWSSCLLQFNPIHDLKLPASSPKTNSDHHQNPWVQCTCNVYFQKQSLSTFPTSSRYLSALSSKVLMMVVLLLASLVVLLSSSLFR